MVPDNCVQTNDFLFWQKMWDNKITELKLLKLTKFRYLNKTSVDMPFNELKYPNVFYFNRNTFDMWF